MAISTSSHLLLLLCSFLVCTAAITMASDINPRMENMTHLHFYFHEYHEAAQHPTSFLVVSLGKNTSDFGDIRVFDNALTEGPEASSELIGRAQGMVVSDSLGSPAAMLSAINFAFTAGQYNGSSLTMYGGLDSSKTVNDRAIVGGSGQFRLARGYSLSKVVDSATSSVVIEFDIYVNNYGYR